MHKRTLAVLALAAAAGVLFPFGLPKAAAATGPTYDSVSIKPLPLEQAGTLSPGGTNTVTACVQPLSGGHVVPGATVFLSLISGLFTAPPATGGTATAGASVTTLSASPTPIVVQPSCTYSNQEGSGTLLDAVQVNYTGPAPTVPVNGRDVIGADIDGTSFNAATGTCTGAGACNTGTYVFSPVNHYVFSVGSTIATTGTLTAGHQVPFTVAADNSTNHGVPGAFIDLSLVPSTGGTVGTATAINILNGNSKVKSVTNFPTRFGADNSGSVSITYTAANPLPTTGDVDTLTAQNHPTETVELATTYTYSGSSPPPTQGPYTPLTPARICDTRPVGPGIAHNQCNTGAGSGPLGQGATRVITVDGNGGVPASGITAVVVNVTAIAPSALTFLSVFPDGSTQATSNLNPQRGATVANLVEVGVSSAGKIDVFNAKGTVNLAIDVDGYVSSAGDLFSSVAPVRVCDTRTAAPGISPNQCNTPTSKAIAGNTALTFRVDSVTGPNATAVVFNLTAINPTASTVLTAYAGGTTRPTASNLNLAAHTTLPNRVIVPVTCVSGDCTVSIWNAVGTVNIAVDIDGWFSASGTQFTPLATPGRICDTRFGNPSDGGQGAGCAKAMVRAGLSHVLNIDVTGIDGVPPGTPVALVLNVTAVNATNGTFVTVYPGTSSLPNASDLNVSSVNATPNLVVVQVGTDGTINLYNAVGNVDLVVDALGYYS